MNEIILILSLLIQPTINMVKEGFSLSVYSPDNKTVKLAHYYNDKNEICNLEPAKDFNNTSINPLILIFDDPDNKGKVCEWNVSHIFSLLPKGQKLELTISRVAEGGVESEPSTRLTFTITAPPKVSNVKLGIKKG